MNSHDLRPDQLDRIRAYLAPRRRWLSRLLQRMIDGKLDEPPLVDATEKAVKAMERLGPDADERLHHAPARAARSGSEADAAGVNIWTCRAIHFPPMTGLVIKEPWIGLILDGKKTWEIRGRTTKPKSSVALIKSGSGQVIGVCAIDGCRGPLSLNELRSSCPQHQIPLAELTVLPYPKTYAWLVSRPRRIQPIRYRHPSGAVIWVNLTKANVDEYDRLLRECG